MVSKESMRTRGSWMLLLSALIPIDVSAQIVSGTVQSVRTYNDSVLAAIAAAAEMPPLESTVLPAGYREIRMRPQQPMVCCDSIPMLRLVEGPGDVSGTLWLFRTLVLRPGNPMARADERCVPLDDQHICVRPWRLSISDWRTVATKLEQLGAWTLPPDPCNPPRIVRKADGTTSMVRGIPGDSGLLSMQRRVGGTVSSVSCLAPDLQREGDALKAREIYAYFISLSGVIPREPIRIQK